ncbi:MAG TPA: acyltransferase, partial [Flavisolibacter sp.]|nr:acyltransferase [Flavisolibacter sp.]
GVFNGVDIFFVLSGFLITRILLENRKEAETLGTSKLQITRNFYIRRFLRIFPIYYAYILVLFILGPKTGTHIRESAPYFLTYTANFYFLQHKWEGMLSHLWSQSVEEQIYLLWPWLMLFLRRTFVLPVILSAIGIGAVCQYFYSDIATICCFDGFGLGALLAWACVYRPDWLTRFYKPSLVLAAICCVFQALRLLPGGGINLVPSRILTSLCTCAVILSILLGKGKDAVLSRYILNNPVLIFIGKISYGIYLYHLAVYIFFAKPLNWINERLFAQFFTDFFYLQIAEYSCILLGVSYASWRLIEQPILRLKKNYTYRNQPATYEGKVRIGRRVSALLKLK